MQPLHQFRHCPRCAAGVPTGANPLACPACGFTYFFNPTVAAAAYIFDPRRRVLFIRRAKEPAKGLLAVPGGFIDIGETAEDALRREVREEVGIAVADVRFLCSCPNEYPYRGVTYPVCDLIFTATTPDPDAAKAKSEVAGIEWRRPEDVTEAELAFPSLKLGLRLIREGR